MKKIPAWAKEPNLHNSLVIQQFSDPDKIFTEVNSCDLEGEFESKN